MEATKHTPTPWHIEANKSDLVRSSDDSHIVKYIIKHAKSDYDSEWITTVANAFSTNDKDKANAEHIVKSVNEYDKLKASHQELLEAAIAVISVADRKTKEFDRLKEATSNAKELG